MANKAVVALVLSFLAAFLAAVVAGNPSTTEEWVVVTLGAVVTAAGVYAVPNTPAR